MKLATRSLRDLSRARSALRRKLYQLAFRALAAFLLGMVVCFILVGQVLLGLFG
jgi:hypothetical protein